MTEPSTRNAEAYQLYLKGQYFFFKLTEEDTKKAVHYYEQAIVADPNYALAYAGLAAAYVAFSDTTLPPKDVIPKAKEAVKKALALDDSLPEAHCALGDTLFSYDWDWPAAEREFKRAIDLNPNLCRRLPFVRMAFGDVGANCGSIERAKACTTT